MTQRDRDRLVTLKKANKKLITQKEAAREMGVTERQVRRLLKQLKRRGDKVVIHASRGGVSNRKIEEEIEQKAISILSQEVYRGFGPTLAAEYLENKHKLTVSRETVRKWMLKAKLWKARVQEVEKVFQWRQRRSRLGEMVQWDTSEHDWLEGRGEKMYLISMIDDATSRLFARMVRHDSTEENMRMLWAYLERYGRPLSFYTDKASLFTTTVKTKRDQRQQGKDRPEMPPTQIGRSLRELEIAWIGAHSPQAKGRCERQFKTAQDRLVKGMRVAAVKTLEEANRYLEQEYLPWWNRTLAVRAANSDDAHRALEKPADLPAILSHVEHRQVTNDYTLRFEAKVYQIDQKDVRTGLRGSNVRVEKRLDGSIAVRFRDRYLAISLCQPRPKLVQDKPAPDRRTQPRPRRGSDWNKNFNLQKSVPLWKAAQSSGARPEELP